MSIVSLSEAKLEGPPSDPRRIRHLLASTGDAAFATDTDGLVTGWNAAAEHLLGHPRAAVVGRSCHEVIRGCDVFGNPYCRPDCSVRLMVRRTMPVRRFQMEVRTRDDDPLRVLCSVLVVPAAASGPTSIVHLLQRARRTTSPWPARPAEHDQPRLTPRELEVLRLLADSSSTGDMADTLHVSTSTVRKHVQNLLRKMGVSSRLAAVLEAVDRQLL